MSHIVEVDQSIRFDNTSDDTVLAYANGDCRSLLIPASVKRDCLRHLRRIGYSTRTLYIRLFTTALYFLLRERVENMSRIVIDLEYPGRDAQIREHLINLLRKDGKSTGRAQIQFARIGKRSPAHELAIETLRRHKVPDLVLTQRDLLSKFRLDQPRNDKK
jgi:hypothetical protein